MKISNDSPASAMLDTAHDDDEEDIGLDSISEAGDTVAPLPEGWPKIPQIFKMHSWNFSTTVSPSVEKATSHLEMLQNVIEERFRQTPSEVLSRDSTFVTKDRHQKFSGSSRKQLTFETTQQHETSLSIEGIGATADLDKPGARTVEWRDEGSGPYLGAEEVVEEVVTLLAKLENDRQETRAALQRERERVVRLGASIDSLSLQRMSELPLAVQREHEACAMDINELKWHLAYRTRLETRIQNKVSVAETLNSKLKDDIEFVKKHIPLVQEKLDLEQDAMDRIELAQMETDDELAVTNERFDNVENKSDEAFAKAQQERNLLKEDLDHVRTELQTASNALSNAKKTHDSYVHSCHDYRTTAQRNAEELKEQKTKEQNAQATEERLVRKVKELQDQIKAAEFEHRKLDNELKLLTTKYENNERLYADSVARRKQEVADRTDKLRQLTRSNNEHDMDIEDIGKKNLNCIRQKQLDERNLERMAKEVARTEEQAELAQEELSNVFIINRAVQEQLRKEEEKCIQSEMALRTTTEALKKQVKEEIHTKTVLGARIKADATEYKDVLAEGNVKRDMVSRKAEEVENAVASLGTKVEKLRSLHNDKSKNIDKYKGELSDIRDGKTKVTDASNQRMTQLQPAHDKAKTELQKEQQALEQFERRLDTMEKKTKEMTEQGAMMTKSMAKTQTAITQLQLDFEELDIRMKTGQRLQDDLSTSLVQVTGRLKSQEKDYKEEVTDRCQVLEKLEHDLASNLSLNKQLAAYYRKLQNDYVEVKNKMLDKFDDRVNVEHTIKDIKQLQGLQRHMQHAMLEYCKYRGDFNKGELSRMKSEALHNGVRVSELQTEMDRALETIAGFLQHQVDGDTVRKMAMEKVAREEGKRPDVSHNQIDGALRPRKVADHQVPRAVQLPPSRHPVTLAEVAL